MVKCTYLPIQIVSSQVQLCPQNSSLAEYIVVGRSTVERQLFWTIQRSEEGIRGDTILLALQCGNFHMAHWKDGGV